VKKEAKKDKNTEEVRTFSKGKRENVRARNRGYDFSNKTRTSRQEEKSTPAT